MKKLVAVLVISLLFAMGSIVYAEGHGMMGEGFEADHGFMGQGPGMMGGRHLLDKIMTLGLDEKQKEAVKEIVGRTARETIKKRADLAVARIDLKDLLDKDTVDMTAVESKLNQIAAIQADIHLSHIKTLEAVKTKLTPDQRRKLKELLEQRMMGGKMGMMKGKGCGMMGEMTGGKMQHDTVDSAAPPDEKGDDMPGMEHGH